MSAAVVLDASVALAVILPEDHTPQAEALLSGAARRGAIVAPAVFPFEIANGLKAAILERRVTNGLVSRGIELIASLPLTVEICGEALAVAGQIERCFAAATNHRLTAYNAAYLELALRRQLPLATLDAKLRCASAKAGVQLFQA